MNIKLLKIGDQIVFKYPHGKREYGFVTSITDRVFCRFWSESNLGSLRTLSCSEACDIELIEKTGENVPQEIINAWLGYIEGEAKRWHDSTAR